MSQDKPIEIGKWTFYWISTKEDSKRIAASEAQKHYFLVYPVKGRFKGPGFYGFRIVENKVGYVYKYGMEWAPSKTIQKRWAKEISTLTNMVKKLSQIEGRQGVSHEESNPHRENTSHS